MSFVDAQPFSQKPVRHGSANTHLTRKKSSTSSVLMPKKSNDSLKEENRSNNNDKHKHKHKNYTRERLIPKGERLIPKSDATLDLARLGHDDNVELRKALIPLIAGMLPDWDDVFHENDIRIKRISGALTNCVFFVTKLHCKKTVILRVYGNGVDQLCDRQKELYFLKKLSTLNIGPKLLGIFANGRFEEYLESETLTKDDLRIPSTSRHIAERMSQLHNIINIFPPSTVPEPEVWVNIDRWYPLVMKAISSNAFKCTEEQKDDLKEFDFESLKYEIQDLKVKFHLNSPIVFAHNDTQYGNILRRTDGSGQLAVVDFEYAGYNYRAFDIANHFCEWMFDYHSSEPHKMHLDWYPNEEQQINFLQSYIQSGKSLISGDHIPTHNNYLQKLKLEVDTFTLASHLMWGLWGLIQSGQSEIKFNYFAYGMQRLKHFRDSKKYIYEHILLNQDMQI